MVSCKGPQQYLRDCYRTAIWIGYFLITALSWPDYGPSDGAWSVSWHSRSVADVSFQWLLKDANIRSVRPWNLSGWTTSPLVYADEHHVYLEEISISQWITSINALYRVSRKSSAPLPSRCARLLTEILISNDRKHNSGGQTVITDFPKENQGVRPVLINSNSLRNVLMTIDEERGTTICRQVCLAERIGIEKDPSRADGHTQARYLRAISDQNWL
jgi:hypothetical protein